MVKERWKVVTRSCSEMAGLCLGAIPDHHLLRYEIGTLTIVYVSGDVLSTVERLVAGVEDGFPPSRE